MAKKDNQEKPKFNSYWVYGIIISILLAMSMFGGDSKWQNLKKTKNFIIFYTYTNKTTKKAIFCFKIYFVYIDIHVI